MAKFIDTSDDKAIVDFNNMTFKQFRYLVKEATRVNQEIDQRKWDIYTGKYYDNNGDLTEIGDR